MTPEGYVEMGKRFASKAIGLIQGAGAGTLKQESAEPQPGDGGKNGPKKTPLLLGPNDRPLPGGKAPAGQAPQAARNTKGSPPVGSNILKLPEALQKRTKFLNPEFGYYQPTEMDASKKKPLLIFLHGLSGRGNDIQRVIDRYGKPALFGHAEKHKLPVLMPQCALGANGDGWWQPADLDLLLLYLAKTKNIDKNRIYLAGFSMGAFGAWSWAIERPQTFAAVVPVAGGGDPNRVGVLRNVAIWVFHGAKDTRVPMSRSQVLVDALKKAGSKNVKFTVDPNMAHSMAPFGDPKLYEWIVQQKK